jgi:response regulator NasT
LIILAAHIVSLAAPTPCFSALQQTGTAVAKKGKMKSRSSQALRVVVMDDDPDRARSVKEALEADGVEVVAVLGSGLELLSRIDALAPDLLIADIDNPDRDMLEGLKRVGQECDRPVVMFAQDGRAETIRAAVEAGVAAYVVDGLQPERVKLVIDVAIARFAQVRSLRAELNKAKTSLAERKLVEKAKGILMKSRQCGEEEAYVAMRKMAMDRKLRLIDIANKIIAAADLLG